MLVGLRLVLSEAQPRALPCREEAREPLSCLGEHEPSKLQKLVVKIPLPA